MSKTNALLNDLPGRLWLGALLVLLMSGCGGGGGGGEGSSNSGSTNTRALWVEIDLPTTEPNYLTDFETLNVSGQASFGDLKAFSTATVVQTGITVSWQNAANGLSGTANQSLVFGYQCIPLLVCIRSVDAHAWESLIPLELGENPIRIVARDAHGRQDQATLVINREVDIVKPSITSTVPADNDVDVGRNSALAMIFSEQMNPSSISAATIMLKDSANNPVSGSISYSDVDTTATFAPSTLLPSTVYTATVTVDVTDVNGVALSADYTWTFTTGDFDIVAAKVIGTYPQGGATCIPRNIQTLEAQFDEQILWSTVNETTFLLRDGMNNTVDGTVESWGSVTKFNPAGLLEPSSLYTATVTTGMTDMSGNALEADHIWAFLTQAAGTGYWTEMSALGAPSPRWASAVVWTGKEMFVWAGSGSGSGMLSDGARYDPATDTWQPLVNAGAPSARAYVPAVWTGSEMIVWGGYNGAYESARLGDGARYDPAADIWTRISDLGAPSGRVGHTAVWTGTEMIVWGGYSGSSFVGNYMSDGARYDPLTDSWTPISRFRDPSERTNHTAVWTGREMIVWGGDRRGGKLATGGRYDPTTDTWSPMSAVGAPSGREKHIAVWTGSEMIVWGGSDSSGALADGARYDPVTDSWKPVTSTCAPLATKGVWTGTDLIVWGSSVGGIYNAFSDEWRPTTELPDELSGSGCVVWTGTEMIVACGSKPGGRYHP